MDNNQEIERIAKELYIESHRNLGLFLKWELLSETEKWRWINLAKYVQKMILKSELETLSALEFMKPDYLYKYLEIRIKSISEQLSDLKETTNEQ